MKFKVCFSRSAAFNWFVVAVTGLLICTEHAGVTCIIRALGLNPVYYTSLLHFFRANSWRLKSVRNVWIEIVEKSGLMYIVKGMPVLVGDGTKVSKEGRKMPAVKKQHQESGNSAKPEYIHGHMFGGIGALIGNSSKLFCALLSMRIQDGNETVGKWAGDKYADESHVVRLTREGFDIALRMDRLCILLLDTYYLSKRALKLLQQLRSECGRDMLTLVTKAKTDAVAWEKPTQRKGPGAPRKRGEKVKMWSLFTSEAAAFTKAKVTLYGKTEEVEYLVKDMLWGEGEYFELRFVFVKWGTTKTLLATTNALMTPEEIIELYGLRFKIECSFRSLKQVVVGFAYRFWTSAMPKLNIFAKNDDMRAIVESVTDNAMQMRIANAFRATERYVMIACIVLGLLQMTALRFGKEIYGSAFLWLRTRSSDTPSEATTADFMRKTIFRGFYFSPYLGISRIIRSRQSAHSTAYDSPAV